MKERDVKLYGYMVMGMNVEHIDGICQVAKLRQLQLLKQIIIYI